MITLIGAGFLGSLFAEELAKRLYALELTEGHELRIVDFDEVEARNCANQLYTPASSGDMKADVLVKRVEEYGIRAEPFPVKLDEDTVEPLLGRSKLIVSATDNMAARNLAWYYAVGEQIPLLHLGISQDGTGNVEWTFWDEYDSWLLSPMALRGRPTPPDPVHKFLPCELVGFRGLGLNTALAGAKSAGIWFGYDPEHTLKAAAKVQAETSAVSWLTTQVGQTVQEIHTFHAEEAHG